MPFRTATVYSTSRLSAVWFNTFIRNPLRYLKGQDGPVMIEDSLIIKPGAGKTAYFQLPSVTTAERLVMFDQFSDTKSAKVVYDSTLGEIWMWRDGQWTPAGTQGTVGEIASANSAETDTRKRLRPDGTGGIEWTENAAERYVFDTSTDSTSYIKFDLPAWATELAFLMIGGGGGGGGGRKATSSSVVGSYAANGGGGGTRGQFRIYRYYTYVLPRRIFIRVGKGGAGGSGNGSSGAVGTASGIYYPKTTDYNSPGTIIGALAAGGRNGLGGNLTTGGGSYTYGYSRGAKGDSYADRNKTLPRAINAGGGGGGCYYETIDSNNKFLYHAKNGSGGGQASYRYDYINHPYPNAGLLPSKVDGIQNAKAPFVDGRLFGVGGGGGGGAGGLEQGVTPAINFNGGNGGHGIQGSGGGGGGGCPSYRTPGKGGNGGDGIVAILVW